MKTLLFSFFVCIPVCLSAQDTTMTSFSGLQEDSVVFYDFNKFNRPHASIVDKKTDRLNRFEKSKKLEQKLAQKLNKLLNDPKSYGGNVAACFDPHLGIVYYKNGEILTYINVCMDCNRLEAANFLEAQKQGPQQSDSGEKYYVRYGMSKSFRKFINKLLVEYNFSHQNVRMPFQ